MNKKLSWILLPLMTLTLSINAWAAIDNYSPKLPGPKAANPTPPNFEATGYVLMDAQTGTIIAEKNAEKRIPPASLTKMMTLYIVSEALKNGQLDLDTKIKISKKAWGTPGSKMFLKEGQWVSIRDLLQGIIVASGNDACVAIAQYLAGSEKAFAEKMNAEAKQIGMKNTHFMDSTGLPNDDHYSTPLDLAILTRALITHYPEYYHWYSQKTFKFNGIQQPNRNRLLWQYEYADGVKTGHTEAAGYCLASSAEKDGMRLIGLIVGTSSDRLRAENSKRLLTYGFRFYKTYALYQPGTAIVSPELWKGANNNVELGINEPIYITIPRDKYNDLKLKTTLINPIVAPVEAGQSLGQLSIELDGKTLVEEPLIAINPVAEGGFWTRFSDSVSLAVHNLIGGHDDTQG